MLVASKVTGPGRRMKYILDSEAPSCIWSTCTLIQIIVCLISVLELVFSVDIDVHTKDGHISIVYISDLVTTFYAGIPVLLARSFVI